jgi:hypothetical protein
MEREREVGEGRRKARVMRERMEGHREKRVRL